MEWCHCRSVAQIRYYNFKQNKWSNKTNDPTKRITSNKIIMDFAIIFIEQTNQKADIINEINAVRLCKKLHLLCKLVGVIRIIQTKCFEDFDKKAQSYRSLQY